MPRPKKTTDFSGSVIGATLGGLLGGPAGAAAAFTAAALGGMIGSSANRQASLPLGEATRQLVQSRNLVFVSVEREGKFVLKIVFGTGRSFFYVRARVPPLGPGRKRWTENSLADALYDQAQKKIDGWLKQNHR